MAVVTWKTTIMMDRNLWIVSHAKERTSRKMWSLPTREPVYLPRSPPGNASRWDEVTGKRCGGSFPVAILGRSL